MTASATARRRGTAATGPPSWKISSTDVSFLRTSTLGMDPVRLQFVSVESVPRDSNRPRLAAKMQGGGANQAFAGQFHRLRDSGVEGCGACPGRQSSHVPVDSQAAQVGVGRELARRKDGDAWI